MRDFHGRMPRIAPDTVVDVRARSHAHARTQIVAMAREAGFRVPVDPTKPWGRSRRVNVTDVQVRVGRSVAFSWASGPRLRAYMAYERCSGPQEGACLVFAYRQRDARRLAAPIVMGWTGCSYIDVEAVMLSTPCAHHRLKDEPHVIEAPAGCDRCEQWSVHPLENGVCRDCLELDDKEQDEAVGDDADREMGLPMGFEWGAK